MYAEVVDRPARIAYHRISDDHWRVLHLVPSEELRSEPDHLATRSGREQAPQRTKASTRHSYVEFEVESERTHKNTGH